MNELGIISGVGIIGIVGYAYYRGFFTTVSDWFQMRYHRVTMILSLIDKIQNDIGSKTSQVAFSINDTDTSASIVYERIGQQYIMLIPYNRKYVAAMSQFKAELLRTDNEPVNITQQPGIPYLIHADSLGGHTIRITNQETNVSHEYPHTEIPMYAEEVMDNE
jgi:hypothetical protein